MPEPTPSSLSRDRRALRSVGVQFFVNGAAFASFVPRLPEVRNELGLGLGELGFLWSLAITVGTLGSLGSPWLIARFGTRRTLIVGAMLLVLALPTVGFAATPIVLLVGMASMSVADGLVDVSMNLQGSWLSARRHTPVMNRLHGLWSLGTVAGGLVAARVAASGVSLEVHLSIAAIAMSAALVFVGRGLLVEDEHHEPVATGSGSVQRPGRLGLVVLAVSGACAITVELVSSDWAAFRLTEDLGSPPEVAILGFVAFTAGMTVGRFGGDWAVARLGDGTVLRGSLAVASLGIAVAAFAGQEAVVIGGYAVAGLGVSTLFPKLYDDAARFVGRRGTGLAWLRTGSSVTALFIPTVVGLLSSTALSVGEASAIVALPCLAVLAALSAASARQPSR